MPKKRSPASWTTDDEMKAISYMARKDKNGYSIARLSKPPSEFEIRRKLKAWIETSKVRDWPDYIDVEKCRRHAESLMPS